MHNLRRLWATTLLLCGLFAAVFSWAESQDRGSRSSLSAPDNRLDFVVGNFEFVLLHELAHFIIDEKNVPIIGPEEDAADYIAATILARKPATPGASQQLMRQFGRSAALSFAGSWRLSQEANYTLPYWDVHALEIQRYYSILCLLYGAELVDGLEPSAEHFGLPLQRAQGCGREFERADQALEWLTETFGRSGSQESGEHATFVYEEPNSLTRKLVLEEIQRLDIFERTVNAFSTRFEVSKPFTAALRSCGIPQAAWIRDKREIVICYELLDVFYLIHQREYHKVPASPD